MNFVNLLDLAGVAVPAGFRPDGLPTGVTFLGPWGSEGGWRRWRPRAAAGGERRKLGATGSRWSRRPPASPAAIADDLPLAVVGAHLSGEPLNHQLTDLGGRLLRTCRTAPLYRLYALAGTTPAEAGAGAAGSTDAAGAAIEVEVWELPRAKLGTLLPWGGAAAGDRNPASSRTAARWPASCARPTPSPAPRTSRRFGGWRNYRRSLTTAV